MEVSTKKNKIHEINRKERGWNENELQINSCRFERVDTFKCLGSYRILSGNKAVAALGDLTRKMKLTIYNSIIRPAVTYRCEA